MPSLFQTSSIEDLAKSIAGLDNDARQKLIAKLAAAAPAEKRDEARKAKMQRIEAAANDPKKKAAIQFAVGALKRLGLTIQAAAEMTVADLDKVLAADSRITLDQRFQLKTALRRIGFLGD
jgi:hypothetical protein